MGKIVQASQPNSLVAGNIKDTVLFEALNKINKQTVLVLELSSWQLELMGEHKIRVPYAVVTNVVPDHLNRYKSMSDYAQAKANIFKWQNQNDAVVMNLDNDWCRRFALKAKAKVYWFSAKRLVKRGCYIKSGQLCWVESGKNENILAISKLKLFGPHNLENVLAAVTVAKVYGLSNQAIAKTVINFKGLHDRMEEIREFKGVKYINDTTATAPVAASAALKSWPKDKVVIIVGGQDKLLPYQGLVKDLKNYAAYVLMLPGTASDKMLKGLKSFKKISLVADMKSAVKKANQVAKAGQIVLLSPGAASFNLFKHEFDRGAKFVQAVKKLS